MTSYIVNAGRVTVLTAVGAGRAYVDVRRGELLPADVPAADVDELLRRGAIERLPDARPVDAPGPAGGEAQAEGDAQGQESGPAGDVDANDPDEVEAMPAGPVAAVLAWVGDDLGRALEALGRERAAEAPRQTLIRQLSRLAEQGEGTD
jgi:hypothetical protein